MEEQPLLRQVALVAARGKTNLVLCVVLVYQVLDDGAGLPDCKVGVWVVYGWHAAIGVDGEIFGFLEVREADTLDLVGDAELFRYHDNLGWVGTWGVLEWGGKVGQHGGMNGVYRVCRRS